ncbi:MAG: hypothetical protein HOG04_17080, partial [Nitrospinaceae bacterium]|nr:hypothetical protein [Nitrospinaceae bacterium]
DKRLVAADLDATKLTRSLASRTSEGGSSRRSILNQIRMERKRLGLQK